MTSTASLPQTNTAAHRVAELSETAAQLEQIVGGNGVIKRKDELFTYECDGLTGYRQRPALVVLPRTTEEVAAVVKLCHDRQLPWIARGAGTGLSGGHCRGKTV